MIVEFNRWSAIKGINYKDLPYHEQHSVSIKNIEKASSLVLPDGYIYTIVLYLYTSRTIDIMDYNLISNLVETNWIYAHIHIATLKKLQVQSTS